MKIQKKRVNVYISIAALNRINEMRAAAKSQGFIPPDRSALIEELIMQTRSRVEILDERARSLARELHQVQSERDSLKEEAQILGEKKKIEVRV